MIRKKITNLRDRIEDGLRSLLGQISPDGRIVVILVMLFLFSAASIYITVSSIYNIGKKSGREQMQIEHIERLELEQQQKADSINQLNRFEYE
ncbi:TraL conjugative transposon family protein [Macellibacteroides fermentans]|uniref:Sensor domain CHASE-containing protein n=1 Tax=Macellibacteroides fermentans TaxID=879969 RepID=A0A8E2D5K3_9PORP|nr:TraL conjugative transposon family protein [Macellibacteroides fermentans]NYI51232.1 sensor domain CHASE-containing protein [Macellibacteroides fermentans]